MIKMKSKSGSISQKSYYKSKNLVDNPKEFLDWIVQKLGFKSITDWYKIKYKDINKYGGSKLLFSHNNSIFELISSVYSDHNWKGNMFQLSKDHWSKSDNE